VTCIGSRKLGFEDTKEVIKKNIHNNGVMKKGQPMIYKTLHSQPTERVDELNDNYKELLTKQGTLLVQIRHMIKLIKTKNNECFYLLTLSFYIDFAISILNRNIWFFVGAAIVKTGIACTDNDNCTLANTFCNTTTCQCLPTHFSSQNKTLFVLSVL
jgi:hypothetical protein